MNFHKILPIILIFLFTAFFLGKDLDKKLIGHHDWNSVVYSASARSLIGKAETGELFYQQDYPPLLPLTLSVSFMLFGIKECSIRLVPIVFTFLTAIMIYFLTKKLLGEKQALVAAILYLNTPLIRYFGKIAVHETITPFFALLVFYTYWLWSKQQNRKNYLFLLTSIFLAELSGWPGYYPVPLITIHYLFFGQKKRIEKVLSWWFVSFISFGIFLLVDYLIVKRMPFASLLNIFLTRTAFSKENIYVFTWLEFIDREFLWIRVYLTRILAILAITGIILLIIKLFSKKNKEKEIFIFLIGIFGLIHLLLFRQLSWLHDYMIIYLFPFLVIVSAKSLIYFSSRLKIKSYLLPSFLVLFMFLESRQFLTDLEKAQDFYPAYRLGSFINKTSSPGEKIYLASIESSKLYGVFFYYYANRNYSAGEPSLKDFSDKLNFFKPYRFLVIDKAHNRLTSDVIDYLKTNYKQMEVDSFLIFDLKSRI